MPLSIDSFNKLILVTSPTTDVDAQTLSDFIEDYMATPVGLLTDGVWPGFAGQGDIQDPQGKIEDPSNPGVFSQIILKIHPQWQIQFWGGSGYTRIYGGKIVGGVSDQPMKATGTAGDITVLESPVDGVTVATGTGLSAEQSSQLEEIHGGVQRKIWLDTTLGVDGTGYQGDPHNSFTSAVDNAEANGITDIVLLSDATADRQLKNFTFEGIGSPVLTLNSQDFKGSKFIDLEIEGTMVSTGEVHAIDCILRNNATGLFGRFDRCGLSGDIVLKTASDSDFVDCYSSISGLARPSIDANGGVCDVSIRGFRGGLTVSGMTNASGTMSVGMAQGRLAVDASNTAGTISCRGVAALTDSSAGSTVDTTGLLRPSEVDEVWKLLGLDPDATITITPAGVDSSDAAIDINFTGDGVTTTTMDRQ